VRRVSIGCCGVTKLFSFGHYITTNYTLKEPLRGTEEEDNTTMVKKKGT
jgi:hypothetical protein